MPVCGDGHDPQACAARVVEPAENWVLVSVMRGNAGQDVEPCRVSHIAPWQTLTNEEVATCKE
jgi:hypothetical protein